MHAYIRRYPQQEPGKGRALIQMRSASLPAVWLERSALYCVGNATRKPLDPEGGTSRFATSRSNAAGAVDQAQRPSHSPIGAPNLGELSHEDSSALTRQPGPGFTGSESSIKVKENETYEDGKAVELFDLWLGSIDSRVVVKGGSRRCAPSRASWQPRMGTVWGLLT